MNNDDFERIVGEEFRKIPARFARRIENVALLLEDAPSEAVRREESLAPQETLLGLYRGVPANERGDFYSGVLPDTITLYRVPLLEEAKELLRTGRAQTEPEAVRLAVHETLWHEIGHYFGLAEQEVREREEAGTNRYTESEDETNSPLA